MDEVKAPDVYGAITAFRWWSFTPPFDLSSSATDFNWHPGVNEAECQAGTNKSHKKHMCGFWCLKTEQLLTSYARFGPIAGQVEVWGNVVEHEKGYRVEYARVTAILAKYSPPSKVNQDQLARIAQYYDVPLIGSVTEYVSGSAPVPAKKKFKVGTRVVSQDKQFVGEVIKSTRYWSTLRLDTGGMRRLQTNTLDRV